MPHLRNDAGESPSIDLHRIARLSGLVWDVTRVGVVLICQETPYHCGLKPSPRTWFDLLTASESPFRATCKAHKGRIFYELAVSQTRCSRVRWAGCNGQRIPAGVARMQTAPWHQLSRSSVRRLKPRATAANPACAGCTGRYRILFSTTIMVQMTAY